jgi:adenylate cyclase
VDERVVNDWQAELDELQARGVWDPEAPDAEDRRALIVRLLGRGVSVEEVAGHTADLGDLATDVSIRPRDERWTSLAAAAEHAGLTLESAHTVWRALGFTEADDHTTSLTGDEGDLLHIYADMAPVIGTDVTLQILRTLSTRLARVAQSERDALRINFEVPQRTSGVAYDDIVGQYWEMEDEILPRLDAALAAVHRHQLVVASRQAWGIDDEAVAATTELAIGFADLVGFTDRSHEMSTSELAEAVSAFDALAHEVVNTNGGSVVKLIGDEVMFAAESAEAGARAALALAEHTGAAALLPDLRVGVAWGRVISRDGDYFGPVVNLAARLVDQAGSGEVVVTDVLHQALEGSMAAEPLGDRPLKGFATPQPLWRLG